jgi:uncharacterized protein YjbI with pentapeptide repeats
MAPGSTWTSVRVRGGKFDFLNLAGAKLTDVVFEGCVIGTLDLGDAEVRSLRCEGTTIDELDVPGARLADVDLSGATLRLVRGIGNLRGTTISAGQLVDLAPLFAEHLGLKVRADMG